MEREEVLEGDVEIWRRCVRGEGSADVGGGGIESVRVGERGVGASYLV